jgi:hypothetical protein
LKEPFSVHRRGRLGQEKEREKGASFKDPVRKVDQEEALFCERIFFFRVQI